MRRRSQFLIVPLLVFLGGVLRSAAQHKGEIEGTVVGATDRAAVAKAEVLLLSNEGAPIWSAATDRDGRFQFQAVKAGRYRLRARKPAFLATEYGATMPGTPGWTIEVSDGHRVSVRMLLMHGAAIEGTIRDEFGLPALNHRVGVFKYRWTSGAVDLETVGVASSHQSLTGPLTDDEGHFRFYELPPGRYLVAVDAMPNELGAAAGRLTTPADIARAVSLLKAGQAGTVGTSIVPRPLPTLNQLIGPAERVDYTPVFFPGTTVPSDAMAIDLAPETERNGIDIQAQFVRTASVAGAVSSGAGASASGVVQLVSLDPATLAHRRYVTTFERAGTFLFRNVSTGRYRLEATTQDGTGSSALRDVMVDGRDASGADLVLAPTVSLAGRVLSDDASFAGMQIDLVPVQPVLESIVKVRTAPVARDGSFAIERIAGGQYRVGVSFTAPDRSGFVKSVILDGAQAGSVLVDLTSSSVGNATVRVERGAVVNGRVSISTGVTAGLSVVAVPADDQEWFWLSPRIRRTLVLEDGSYALMGLPEGRYILAAVTLATVDDLFDPAVRAQLPGAGFELTLTRNELRRQDFRLGSSGRLASRFP